MAEPLTIPEARRGGSSRATVLLLAIASGTAVADLYYVQPLLVTIGNAFHVAGSRTGLFVTLTQIGYACGLLFLVPLGDLFDRRSLILGFFGIGSAGLAFAAISPNASLFAVASVLIGLLSVSAQIIVPYAAHMASDDSRGKTVGTVMSGLLIGILLARTFSGIISHVAGWRTVYIVGAGMLLLLMAVMWRRLPSQPAEKSVGSYPRLLASVLKLVRTQPVLRRRSLYGACVFAAFSVFWTSATFLLSHAPYHYNDAVIGLFGLFGVAGALSASFAGRMADRGHAHIGTGVFLLLALVSFAASAWGGLHLAGVIAACSSWISGYRVPTFSTRARSTALTPRRAAA